MAKVSNRRQEIAEKALELFSVNGYEATSLSMIADAVGIRKASIFNHYSNKQAILDDLISMILRNLDEHSVFSKADWDNEEFTSRFRGMNAESASEMVIRQVELITTDESISRARKMLVLEQFRDKDLAALLTKQNHTDVLNFFTGMMSFLIKDGVLSGDDPEMMASMFAFPVSCWISLIDREPEKREEVHEFIRRHVKEFFRIYKKEK